MSIPLSCLDCKVDLESVEQASASFLRCPSCGAAWIRDAEFAKALEASGGPPPNLVQDNEGAVRRPCPECGADMAIVWLDFLQLDQCSTHGLWFDGGELSKALGGDFGTNPGAGAERISPDTWRSIFKKP